MKNTLYLAYGSNLCIEQMAYRCPSATVVGNAILKNRRLIFSGTPGNCHASVVKTKGYSTPVLVWSITAECEKALDRYEGFPIYYRKESVYIQLGTSRRKAMLVEPFVYNGATYLPLHSLTNMLTDKEVTYDGNSQSIYIGSKPMAASTPLDQLNPYSGGQILTGKDAQFEILGKIHSPFNCIKSGFDSSGGNDKLRGTKTYIIESNYSEINGMFVYSYEDIGNSRTCELKISSVDQYGTETLLDSYKVKAGDNPVVVKTNIKGVNILKIVVYDKNGYGGRFYDIALTTAN